MKRITIILLSACLWLIGCDDDAEGDLSATVEECMGDAGEVMEYAPGVTLNEYYLAQLSGEGPCQREAVWFWMCLRDNFCDLSQCLDLHDSWAMTCEVGYEVIP
jgi:hypothetical protein